MGRTKRNEKGERKERRVVIIERSGFVNVKFRSTANHRLHKNKDEQKPQKQRKSRLVFA